jgi:microcompartment protein CcmK/EutM
MFLAQVVGTVVSPVQHPALERERLLLVRPLRPDGTAAKKTTRIALDRAGAGVGERVLVVDEGNSGRQLVARENAPVKTVIVGVVDFVELEGELVYDARRAEGSACARARPRDHE